MTIIRLPKEKEKTPAEWQAIYYAEFKRELLHNLPWIVLAPAALLGSVVFYFGHVSQELSFAQVVQLLLVYGVLAAGLWLALGPVPPRHNEGEITRRILEAARKQNG